MVVYYRSAFHFSQSSIFSFFIRRPHSVIITRYVRMEAVLTASIYVSELRFQCNIPRCVLGFPESLRAVLDISCRTVSWAVSSRRRVYLTPKRLRASTTMLSIRSPPPYPTGVTCSVYECFAAPRGRAATEPRPVRLARRRPENRSVRYGKIYIYPTMNRERQLVVLGVRSTATFRT